MDKAFEYDEIGNWSEAKLDIIRNYASKYTTIMSKQSFIKKCIYIDAFSGAGTHISRTTGDFVLGSPLNALNVVPPFNEFHFIDLDGDKASALRKNTGEHQNVSIYQGDANTVLKDQVFPKCKFSDYRRALCLLDPYSLSVDWNVLLEAGKLTTIEIFYNFMIMDANMNVLWRDPEKVSSVQSERMDKVWGDGTWREIAYVKQIGFFEPSFKKTGNEVIAEEFRKRIQNIAGFKFVPKPVLMKNDNGATIYYLYFATNNEKGATIVDYIFEKYRARGTV